MRVHYLSVSRIICAAANKAVAEHIGSQEIEIYVNPVKSMREWLQKDFVEDKTMLLKLIVPYNHDRSELLEVHAYKNVIVAGQTKYRLYVRKVTKNRLRELTNMFGDLRLKPTQFLTD
jgi:hypothetical protein